MPTPLDDVSEERLIAWFATSGLQPLVRMGSQRVIANHGTPSRVTAMPRLGCALLEYHGDSVPSGMGEYFEAEVYADRTEYMVHEGDGVYDHWEERHDDPTT